MSTRVAAEAMLRALTGGAYPGNANTIIWDDSIGWTFGLATGSGNDFLLYHVGWYLAETIATALAFGFRWNVDPGATQLSFQVTYDAGSGEVTYAYDLAVAETPELHTLMQSDGTTPFVTTNAQTSFSIAITPYDATGGTAGGGTAGETLTIHTGDVLRAGRGMNVEQLDATVLSANIIRPSAPFEFNLDVTDQEIELDLSPTYPAGTLGATWDPDYNNGPTQQATAGQAVTIGDISNFPDGGTMNLHIDRAGFQVDFDGTYFEGPTLSFATNTYLAVSVVDFGLSKLVVAGISY